jgi:hypothetical protein
VDREAPEAARVAVLQVLVHELGEPRHVGPAELAQERPAPLRLVGGLPRRRQQLEPLLGEVRQVRRPVDRLLPQPRRVEELLVERRGVVRRLALHLALVVERDARVVPDVLEGLLPLLRVAEQGLAALDLLDLRPAPVALPPLLEERRHLAELALLLVDEALVIEGLLAPRHVVLEDPGPVVGQHEALVHDALHPACWGGAGTLLRVRRGREGARVYFASELNSTTSTETSIVSTATIPM